MEVDPPLHLQAKNSLHHNHSQDTQPTPENAELGTEQIKIILSFGKDLQRLYDNITSDSPNDKLKVLLQVLYCDANCQSFNVILADRTPSAC